MSTAGPVCLTVLLNDILNNNNDTGKIAASLLNSKLCSEFSDLAYALSTDYHQKGGLRTLDGRLRSHKQLLKQM